MNKTLPVSYVSRETEDGRMRRYLTFGSFAIGVETKLSEKTALLLVGEVIEESSTHV